MENHRLVNLILITAIIIVFAQVLTFDFINLNDPNYVVANAHIRQGVSVSSLARALTTTRAFNWHPLTWVSHMLDMQFLGLKPGAHHFTSLILHMISSLLLFLVLRRMTDSLKKSAVVAVLFALHPLHVESVVWIAERKDVLGAFFWMLTMLAYLDYTKNKTRGRYALVLLAFALGLMANPVLVTLPIVLLILDYWPLRRTATFSSLEAQHSTTHLWFLVHEKIPMLALAVASGMVTYFAQQGAVAVLDRIPLTVRAANAFVVAVVYLIKTFWPAELAVFYPYPGNGLPIWQVMLSVTLLAGTSIIVWRNASRRPYLAAGWLWYLVTLVPVSGLIQISPMQMADHFTYVPLIGIFIMIAWGIPDLLAEKSEYPFAAGILRHRSTVIVCGFTLLMTLTTKQVSYWRNSITLYRHAIAVNTDNWAAHSNLGVTLAGNGRTNEAVFHYLKALKINSDDKQAHYNLGNAYTMLGSMNKAIAHYRAAISVDPDFVEAHSILGNVLIYQLKLDEAIVHFEKAVKIKPAYKQARLGYGNALAAKGKADEASKQYDIALKIDPYYSEAHFRRGLLMDEMGNIREAINEYTITLKLTPNILYATNNLAWILATNPDKKYRNPNVAVALARQACKLTCEKQPDLMDTLAAAYAAQGAYDKAVEVGSKALKLALSMNEIESAKQIRQRVTIYKARRSLHIRPVTLING